MDVRHARGAHAPVAPARVLMTADAVGGVWPYAVELARALAPHGTRVHVATMGPRPRDAQRAEAAAAGVTVHESDWALEWMDDPWDDVWRAGEWLLALEATLAPDLVHLNGYAHAALGWRAPVTVVAHSCVCSWWEAVKDEPAPDTWDRYRDAVAAGLAAADVVVAPTRAMADVLGRHYGDRMGGGVRQGVRVVPNARRAADYAPAAKAPIVLTAGRLWDEAKNVAAVVRAATALPAGDRPWVAYVAGDSTPPGGARVRADVGAGPACHGQGDEHGASVRWLGTLPAGELAQWMARAAVYALPARYEPFGLSALEAGLAGCALVLGDVPSLREVWGDAALFVAPDDPRQLAATLHTLAVDDAYRTALGTRAQARALAYTPERMAAGYLDAYAAAAEVAPLGRGAPACA